MQLPDLPVAIIQDSQLKRAQQSSHPTESAIKGKVGTLETPATKLQILWDGLFSRESLQRTRKGDGMFPLQM